MDDIPFNLAQLPTILQTPFELWIKKHISDID